MDFKGDGSEAVPRTLHDESLFNPRLSPSVGGVWVDSLGLGLGNSYDEKLASIRGSSLRRVDFDKFPRA